MIRGDKFDSILVVNKMDLLDENEKLEITKEMEEYSKELRMPYILASAKSNQNVDIAFTTLIQKCCDHFTVDKAKIFLLLGLLFYNKNTFMKELLRKEQIILKTIYKIVDYSLSLSLNFYCYNLHRFTKTATLFFVLNIRLYQAKKSAQQQLARYKKTFLEKGVLFTKIVDFVLQFRDEHQHFFFFFVKAHEAHQSVPAKNRNGSSVQKEDNNQKEPLKNRHNAEKALQPNTGANIYGIDISYLNSTVLFLLMGAGHIVFSVIFAALQEKVTVMRGFSFPKFMT
ncbi:hypothetical protein RFI_17041, partial [Reticulomyxa filosa]